MKETEERPRGELSSGERFISGRPFSKSSREGCRSALDQAREKGWDVHSPTDGMVTKACWPGRKFQERAGEMVIRRASPARASIWARVLDVPKLR